MAYGEHPINATYPVALPDEQREPDAPQPTLEIQIELACAAINKANSELEKAEHERSKALKNLAEAREKLLQKCNRAGDVLNAHEKPKTATH